MSAWLRVAVDDVRGAVQRGRQLHLVAGRAGHRGPASPGGVAGAGPRAAGVGATPTRRVPPSQAWNGKYFCWFYKLQAVKMFTQFTIYPTNIILFFTKYVYEIYLTGPIPNFQRGPLLT